MLKLIFGYVKQNILLKLLLLASFYYFNMITRKF